MKAYGVGNFSKKMPEAFIGQVGILDSFIVSIAEPPYGLISHIIHEKGIPEEEMRSRHANME